MDLFCSLMNFRANYNFLVVSINFYFKSSLLPLKAFNFKIWFSIIFKDAVCFSILVFFLWHSSLFSERALSSPATFFSNYTIWSQQSFKSWSYSYFIFSTYFSDSNSLFLVVYLIAWATAFLRAAWCSSIKAAFSF